ncbi:hypothetical protein D3C77_699720 [compost metagenome]
MARKTIDELNLNSPRLTRARKAVLDSLNNNIQDIVNSGRTIDYAIGLIAKSVLRKNRAGDWPSFFSAIRFYLGQQAEENLVHPL